MYGPWVGYLSHMRGVGLKVGVGIINCSKVGEINQIVEKKGIISIIASQTSFFFYENRQDYKL